jgi:hypothetical protein
MCLVVQTRSRAAKESTSATDGKEMRKFALDFQLVELRWTLDHSDVGASVVVG